MAVKLQDVNQQIATAHLWQCPAIALDYCEPVSCDTWSSPSCWKHCFIHSRSNCSAVAREKRVKVLSLIISLTRSPARDVYEFDSHIDASCVSTAEPWKMARSRADIFLDWTINRSSSTPFEAVQRVKGPLVFSYCWLWVAVGDGKTLRIQLIRPKIPRAEGTNRFSRLQCCSSNFRGCLGRHKQLSTHYRASLLTKSCFVFGMNHSWLSNSKQAFIIIIIVDWVLFYCCHQGVNHELFINIIHRWQ